MKKNILFMIGNMHSPVFENWGLFYSYFLKLFSIFKKTIMVPAFFILKNSKNIKKTYFQITNNYFHKTIK